MFQVLRHDWNGGMTYLWPAFGLAEAVEESGDLYGASEIHRHVGFYYLYRDPRPAEAVRRLAHSLALRERFGDLRRVPSALVALGHAELAAGDARRAAAAAYRAVEVARDGRPARVAPAVRGGDPHQGGSGPRRRRGISRWLNLAPQQLDSGHRRGGLPR